MSKHTTRMTPEFEARLRELAEGNLPGLPPSVTGKVFDKAWEDGHADGLHAVANEYEEIAVIAMAAWEAGRKREIDR